jgi:hypothetical protein
MHEGAIQCAGIFIVPILRYMKRWLDRAYEVVLLMKSRSRCHSGCFLYSDRLHGMMMGAR